MLGRLAIRLVVLMLTLLTLVYGVSRADTGCLNLSYHLVVMRRRRNLFACYEVITILTEVKLVTNLITGSLLIVRVLNVIVRTIRCTVLTLTVYELMSVRGLIELLTMLTDLVVLAIGLFNIPFVVNLSGVVILFEHGVTTIAIVLGVTLLKTSRCVYGNVIVMTVRRYVIGNGRVTALTYVSCISCSGTGCFDIFRDVVVRKNGRCYNLLFSTYKALEDLVACIRTGSFISGNEFPLVTGGLGDNIIANTAARAPMMLVSVGGTAKLYVSVLLENEIVAKSRNEIMELLITATHTVVESISLGKTGCDNVGGKYIVTELLTTLSCGKLGNSIIGEVLGIEYRIALITYLDVLSLNQSGNVSNLTVLIGNGSEIPYDDIVGILAFCEHVRNLDSYLTIKVSYVLTVNGHLEVIYGLALEESLLLLGEAFSHLINLSLIYGAYGEINVRSAELLLSSRVESKRCIVELKLVLKIVAGSSGAVTTDYGLGLTTLAHAAIIIVMSLGSAIALGVRIRASGTSIGLDTVYTTGSLSCDSKYVIMNLGDLTVVVKSFATVGTYAALYGLEHTGLALYGNLLLRPFDILAVTGCEIAIGYSLLFTAVVTGVYSVACIGTGRKSYLTVIPCVTGSLFGKSLTASGAIGISCTGSTYCGVTKSILSFFLGAAAVGASILNVACLGTGSILGLNNAVVVTKSLCNVGVVAIATLRADMYGISTVVTGGSNNALFIGVAKSCYDLGLGIQAYGANSGLKTGRATGRLYYRLLVGVTELGLAGYSLGEGTSEGITLSGDVSVVSTISLNLNLDDIMIAETTVSEGLSRSVTTARTVLEVNCRRLTGSGSLKILRARDLNENMSTAYNKFGILNHVGAIRIVKELSTYVTRPVLFVTISSTGRKLRLVIGGFVSSKLTVYVGLSTLQTALGATPAVNCELLTSSLGYKVSVNRILYEYVIYYFAVFKSLATAFAASAGIIVKRSGGAGRNGSKILLICILLIKHVIMMDSGDKYGSLILNLNGSVRIREIFVTSRAGPVLIVAILIIGGILCRMMHNSVRYSSSDYECLGAFLTAL